MMFSGACGLEIIYQVEFFKICLSELCDHTFEV